jgi:hypothetical protein
MRKIDREAVTRAIEMLRKESPGRSKQIDDSLASEPWEQVARWCAYCCQCNTLHLKIYQSPPCWTNPSEIRAILAKGDDGIHGHYAAAKLLRRMLAAGLSRYEPDPPAALARMSTPSVKSANGAPERPPA